MGRATRSKTAKARAKAKENAQKAQAAATPVPIPAVPESDVHPEEAHVEEYGPCTTCKFRSSRKRRKTHRSAPAVLGGEDPIVPVGIFGLDTTAEPDTLSAGIVDPLGCPITIQSPPLATPFQGYPAQVLPSTIYALTSFHAMFEYLERQTQTHLRLQRASLSYWIDGPLQEHLHLSFYPTALKTNDLLDGTHRVFGKKALQLAASWTEHEKSIREWRIALYRDTTRPFLGDTWFAILMPLKPQQQDGCREGCSKDISLPVGSRSSVPRQLVERPSYFLLSLSDIHNIMARPVPNHFANNDFPQAAGRNSLGDHVASGENMNSVSNDSTISGEDNNDVNFDWSFKTA